LVVLGPETAYQIARDGISKAQVQEYFFAQARCRFEENYRPDSGQQLDLQEMMKYSTNLWRDGTVTIADKADDIAVVVTGGPGRQSIFFPASSRSTSIILRIDPAIRRK
jgi:hypothetical protein